MKKVVVYVKPGCTYCTRVKGLLDRKKVSFEEIDMTRDPEVARDVASRSGQMTAPQVFADGVPLGGSDDLHALEAQGKLDAALGLT